MKILFVCMTDPRETAYGGQQRTHVIWKGLQSVGDVWTVVPVSHKWMEARDEQSHIYKICLERRYSAGWLVQRLLARWFPQVMLPLGLNVAAISSAGLKPDVCVARTLGVASRFALWRVASLFVDVDDTPTVDFSLANPHKRFKRWVLERWQNWVCSKAKVLWVPDPDQILGLRPFKAVCLPNVPVAPLPDFADELGRSDTLCFIGLLAHEPNRVAIDWFLKSMWLDLKKEFSNLELEICGGGLSDELKVSWSSYPGVRLRGFVRDLRPCYQKALAILTPMRIGSGTCLKVLEALRMGRPVLSTQQGLRGIRFDSRDSSNGLFSFEDVPSLVEAIRTLRTLDRLSVQRAAVAFIQRNNSQDFVNQTLLCDLKDGVSSLS